MLPPPILQHGGRVRACPARTCITRTPAQLFVNDRRLGEVHHAFWQIKRIHPPHLREQDALAGAGRPCAGPGAARTTLGCN